MRKGVLAYILILAVILVTLGPVFARNVYWLLSERALSGLIEARYDWVLLYVILFSCFALFLFIPFHRDRWQKCNIIYVAFIIALFTEMFGFPLTVYLLSSSMTLPNPDFEPAVALAVDLPGLQFKLLMTSLIAGIASIASGMMIILGWKEIYARRSRGRLVTGGIYRYVRHPQYTGIILISLSWLFAWPTLPTLVMWPVLAYAYYRLARKEERMMAERFGKDFASYKSRVPMFLPGWNR